MNLLTLPGKTLAFVLSLPFKAFATLLRFSLGTKSLRRYFEDRFEGKRLRLVLKEAGKSVALVEAARSGHQQMVETLLETDVPSDARSDALMAAAAGGHVEIGRLLLQNGADVGARDQRGWTPLIWAAWAGRPQFMRLLLQAGADVNATEDEHGWTPLLALLSEPHLTWLYVPAATVLLEAGADTSRKGKDGRSALDWARGRRVEELVHLLGDPTFVARADMMHDVFGAITYQARDQRWSGACSLPRFAEWGRGRALDTLSKPEAGFLEGRFPLTIRDDAGDGPRPEQAAAFQFLKDNEPQACKAVMAALLDSANYDERPPKYRTATQLKPIARCTGVEISTECAGGYAYCGFSFETDWEIEHGLTVVFHPKKRAFWGDTTALDSIDDTEAEDRDH